jgi:hypothetical protein
MTIKFEKQIDLLGEVWYYIRLNDTSIKATQDENVAKEFYKEIIQRAKEGYPKTELIEFFTIPEPPKQ